MRSDYTVFKYTIWYDGTSDIQYRYVAALTEEEADKKLDQYNDMLEKQGLMRFHTYYQPVVELDYVII